MKLSKSTYTVTVLNFICQKGIAKTLHVNILEKEAKMLSPVKYGAVFAKTNTNDAITKAKKCGGAQV